MWWFLRLSGVSAALAIALALAFSVGFGGGQLRAGEERKALQLEVIVNNVPVAAADVTVEKPSKK